MAIYQPIGEHLSGSSEPRPALLVAIELSPDRLSRLEQAYSLHYAPTLPERQQVIADQGGSIRAVLTNGSIGFTGQQIAGLPHLGIICCMGAGFENVDQAAARARDIVVTHGPGTNDATVADHAMALLLALVRGIAEADRGVRAGGWSALRAPRPVLWGKRLGIIGLGTIGAQIARRAAGGFDMEVSYHNRRPRPELPYRYVPDPQRLAAEVDFLVLACPGGPATRHLAGADLLRALGPAGYLVNIGRGTVVDTNALIEALHGGIIAGAALDVLEGEPAVPDALRAVPNLILTPHIGGRSPEAVRATTDLVLANLAAYFAGKPPLTPIPG